MKILWQLRFKGSWVFVPQFRKCDCVNMARSAMRNEWKNLKKYGWDVIKVRVTEL